MKKSFALLLLVTGLTGAAFAQKIPDRPDGPPPHHKKGGRGRLPLKELELTDAQRDAFRKHREGFKQKMDALKKEDNITVKEWRSRMEALRKENQTALQGILTPEQKKKMKNMREGRQAQQLQGMKDRLGLSDDQLSQLKKQRSATQKEVQAIRGNTSLSPEQKKESLKRLMKEQREQVDKLLTPEQRAKRKEMRPPHGPRGRRPHPDGPPPAERPASTT